MLPNHCIGVPCMKCKFILNRGRRAWIVTAVVTMALLTGCAAGPGPTEQTNSTRTVTDATDTTQPVVSPESTSEATPIRTQSETADEGETNPVTTTVSKTTLAALDSRLYALTTASDPAAYAAEHDLDYRNGSVAAVVELKKGRTLPEEFDLSVTASAGSHVEVYVQLAEHANTTVVRTRDTPKPA